MAGTRSKKQPVSTKREVVPGSFEDRITDWGRYPPKKLPPPMCKDCLHLRSPITWHCDAFPKGIPAEILTGEFDHHAPHPNDNGIQYEVNLDAPVAP